MVGFGKDQDWVTVLMILFAKNAAIKSIKKEVKMKIARPVIKITNDKWSLKDWIISNFPEGYEEMTYVEPYGGTVDLLFTKKKSKFEIINDQNLEIINIYRAIRDESAELIKRINSLKCTPESFDKVIKKQQFEDYLDQATNDLILRKLSKGGLKQKFQKPSNLESWKSSVKSLAEYSTRIKDVYITNKQALDIIHAFNTKDSLIYCDPPYLHENKVSKSVYSSEMTPECHMKLYHVLQDFKGKVILSGCTSPLYNRLYKNWNIEKKRIDKDKSKQTEIIWKNF